jgi:transcriptional regulator with XRE-family HTH domain
VTLKEFITERKLRLDALALLGGVDKGTVSRIANGKVTAKPETVVALARALGTSARRMQSMCDASWAAAHEDEEVIAR